MAYQGKQKLDSMIAYSPIEFFPDSKGYKVKIPGGLLLRRVDTTFFKSDLAEKLSIAAGDPGTFWLHSNTVERHLTGESGGILIEYAKEMCAEVFNPETMIWENPRNRPNHYWDCEVMALVAAWELKLKNRKAPASGPLQNAPLVSKPHPVPRPVSTGERLAAVMQRRR